MLYEENVLRFINKHRKETIKACNFFYKGLDGKYVDANERTSFIAGVDNKSIINKRDIELQWSAYSQQYAKSDRLALAQNKDIASVEQGINLLQEHVPTLSLKQAAVDNNGKPLGVFGAVIYIEEMSLAELSQIFGFIHHWLCIKPKTEPTTLFNCAYNKQNLTPREKECAHFLCLGMSAREIAFELNLSKRTIEFYIANMKNKLGVVRKSELVKKLIENKLGDSWA